MISYYANKENQPYFFSPELVQRVHTLELFLPENNSVHVFSDAFIKKNQMPNLFNLLRFRI